MADLPDVNVWVALTAEDHPLHRRAEAYWRTEADGLLRFCRTTALGLVRVTSHKHTFGGSPMRPADAWASYLKWCAQPMVDLLTEPAGIDELISEWSRQELVTPRNWTDVYLAAFAVAGNLRLVTFDRDFKVFPGLSLLHLVQ
jgi:uncharacterized protein